MPVPATHSAFRPLKRHSLPLAEGGHSSKQRLVAGLLPTNARPDRRPGLGVWTRRIRHWTASGWLPCLATAGLGIVWSRPVRPSPVTSFPVPRSAMPASSGHSLCSAQKNGPPTLSLCAHAWPFLGVRLSIGRASLPPDGMRLLCYTSATATPVKKRV